MLGRPLKKQRIPVCILQRSSWPFTGTLLCCLAPACLSPKLRSACLDPLPSSCTGAGRARQDRTGPTGHSCCAVGPQHCNLSEFRVLLDFSNSYFKRLLLPHPASKGITLCMYLFLFSAWIWVFPKASLPPSGTPDSKNIQIYP